jgi:alcohol dehydrogenase class IV
MDTAKGCNFLLHNGGSMADYRGYGLVKNAMLPFIAIPTTAGTGSECQSYAVVSRDDSHEKMACGDPKALARIAILDPELTVSQPQSVAVLTALDALSHALESAVCTKRNPVSSAYSAEAFRLIASAIRPCSTVRRISKPAAACCSVPPSPDPPSKTACSVPPTPPPTHSPPASTSPTASPSP